MALDMVLPAIILLGIVVAAMAYFIRRASALVRELERANRSKSSFLASMSHEVRTPLNAILGFSELMSLELYGKVEGEKNKEYLRLIQDSGGHLLAIINDILDISKLEAGKFNIYAEKIQPCQIVDTCVRTIEASAKDRSITITQHCHGGTIFSDERVMRQILINILSNAIKFTNPGGAVHIIGEQLKGQYQILISDNGVGMSAEEIDVAFSTFGQVANELTKKHRGTGLGLPLVKRFITLLDGSVGISSNPGKGTSVTLSFPLKTTAKNL
jgi:signal transduction histidine kinase